MKTILCVRQLVVFVITLSGLTLHVFAAKTPVLRYRGDAQTNVFKVSIETRGESGTERLEGKLIVTTKTSSTNVIALTVTGSLSPKREPGVPMYGGMGRMSRLSQPMSFMESCVVLMDAQGRILRSAGDQPLPFPLGSIAQCLVVRLPNKAETKWENVEEAIVMEDPMGLGPAKSFGMASTQYGMSYGYYPGSQRGGPGMLAVTHRIGSEITNSTASTVTILENMSITSPLRVGEESRIGASGQGAKVFDVQGGFLRAAHMQYQALINTESSTRRITAKFQFELIEGKEREAALMPLTDKPILDANTGQYVSRKLTGEALQKVFEDLRSDDAAKKQSASTRLQNSEVVDPPRALVDFMTNHLSSSETMLKMVAVKIVADFGGTERIPDLLRLLKSSDSYNRNNVIQALGRLKDPRAIAPLVDCIAKGDNESYAAKSALEKFGPEAEDSVLTLLKENHTQTKRTACEILQKIGTQKSIEPLKELVVSADQFMTSAAAEALRAIQSRQ